MGADFFAKGNKPVSGYGAPTDNVKYHKISTSKTITAGAYVAEAITPTSGYEITDVCIRVGGGYSSAYAVTHVSDTSWIVKNTGSSNYTWTIVVYWTEVKSNLIHND